MVGRIPERDIAEIRDRTRIEDLVGEYVALRPAGIGSMKGLCPFHDENTPSFHVRPNHGHFHCFGCGEGGDVIAAWALGQLALRHDVIAVHLIDPMQRALPNVGQLPMRDPETGEQLWVDTANPKLRARHAQLVAEQDARNAQAFARAGVDVLELATDEDLPQAVVRQLHMRQAPRAAAAAHASGAAHG